MTSQFSRSNANCTCGRRADPLNLGIGSFLTISLRDQKASSIESITKVGRPLAMRTRILHRNTPSHSKSSLASTLAM